MREDCAKVEEGERGVSGLFFVVIFKEMAMNNFQFLLYVSGCIVRSMSDLPYFKIPNKFVREIGIFS